MPPCVHAEGIRGWVSRLLLLGMVLIAARLAFPQDQPSELPQTLTVGTIDVSGLARYERDWFIEASGVVPGGQITLQGLEAAAARLLETGLFARVGDRYVITGDRVDISWEVSEVEWGLPVIMDNFIWFTDAELWEAIARRVPSYDGTAPRTDGVVNTISVALQEVLAAQKIPGRVDHMLSFRDVTSHVFTVEGISMPICNVGFTGVAAIPQKDLVAEIPALTGTDYSRHYFQSISSNILSLYHRRGYLQAIIGNPRVKPQSVDGCVNGVHVTFALREGVRYSLGSVTWAGNNAITSEKLRRSLSLETGDVVDERRMDDDLSEIHKTYAQLGYLAAGLKTQKRFNPEGIVDYHVVIDEGPLYRMGKLTLGGMSEEKLQRLRKRWRLVTGEAFDASYPSSFADSVLKAGLAQGGVRSRWEPDHENLTVDVTITFLGK